MELVRWEWFTQLAVGAVQWMWQPQVALSISVCWAVGALCGLSRAGSEEGWEEEVLCTGHLIQGGSGG